ncbi:MAG: hypothetical protein AAFO03_04985 [Bacteroidota bacterium]
MESVFPFAALPLIVIVFVVIFFFVIPNLGDWKKLAQRFSTNHSPKTVTGERIHFGQINIGGLNMKNMVKGYITHKGLFLYQYLDLLERSPKILIPWDDFQSVEVRKVLFIRMYRVYVGQPTVSYLEFSKYSYNRLADRLPKPRE